MTIASDLGFVIGETYRVSNPDVISRDDWKIRPGDLATFVRDDGSRCPYFTVDGERVWLFVESDEGPEVLPEPYREQRFSAESSWRTGDWVLADESLGLELPEHTPVALLGEIPDDQCKSGIRVAFKIRGEGKTYTCCKSWFEEVPVLPPVKQSIAELRKENASINRQLAHMRERMRRKEQFYRDNSQEICRQLAAGYPE